MKRTITFLIALVLIAAAIGAQAPVGRSGVKLDVGAQYNLGILASQWSMNFSSVYQMGFPGFGGGMKSFFGVGYDALYVAPYARLELGWFYFGVGPLVLIQTPEGADWATPDSELSFMGTTGFAIPLIPIGPGRLGIDTGLDVSATPFRIPETESTGNPVGDFFAALAVGTMGAVFNTLKVNLGLIYTVHL